MPMVFMVFNVSFLLMLLRVFSFMFKVNRPHAKDYCVALAPRTSSVSFAGFAVFTLPYQARLIPHLARQGEGAARVPNSP